MNNDFLSKILGSYAWLMENKGQIGAAIAAIVFSATALVKALQKLVDMFEHFWPGISKADSIFGKMIGGLAWVSHSPFLAWLSGSPAPAHAMATAARMSPPTSKEMNPKMLLIPLLLGAMLCGAPAKAQVLSTGPTIPLIEVRLADPATGKTATGLLAAGAGYGASLGFSQIAWGGKAYDLLDLNLMAFGTIGQEAGQTLDAFSLALGVGTLNNLISVGFLADLVQVYGSNTTGLFTGSFGKQNMGVLLSVSFQFASGPYTPPTGVAEGAAGMPRGNTVYW